MVSVDPSSGRIRLTLKTGASTAPTAPPTDPFQGLQPGQLVQGRVLKTEETPGKTALVLEVWDAAAEEAVEEGRGAPARLELPGQVADHPAASAALLPLLSKPGTVFGGCALAQSMPILTRMPIRLVSWPHGADRSDSLGLCRWVCRFLCCFRSSGDFGAAGGSEGAAGVEETVVG